ncbi:MAG TPA: ATP-binding protein [Syntrophobacter fumaroxidans]|nr:ATP-binding protein [Syntrophobacter fumaroxidans]
MTMSLPLFPIWIVDLAGSALMIVFSFMCVVLAGRLKDQDRNNVVWTYLLWLSYALAAFAVSRSVGHILKRILLGAGLGSAWESLKPYSGAVNTITFMVVASITLFFERSWKIYQEILGDRQALVEAHEKVLFVNRNLEGLIAERTRELALSERKYRRIFEVSRDMIMLVSPQGRILDLNPAGAEMLGVSMEDTLSGKVFLKDFLHSPADWDRLENELIARGYVPDTELLFRKPDHSAFSVLLSCATENFADGRFDAIHLLVKDISQRKTMEQQLLQADKLASVGQLAAGIAHEINNPLSVILGYTQLLLRNEPQGTQRYEDYRIVEKHARTCKRIVGDLLSFARSTKTTKGEANVNVVIEETLDVLRHHFELDGIGIEQEFDPSVPTLSMDREKIKQVLMNLLMNAKQAIGKKKGRIRLVTRYDREGRAVSIQVADDGCGIAPQSLPRIFDPFFTTKGTGEGTGLGLSVSYGIVQDHGGEIRVESEPTCGATFTLILPVAGKEPDGV